MLASNSFGPADLKQPTHRPKHTTKPKDPDCGYEVAKFSKPVDLDDSILEDVPLGEEAASIKSSTAKQVPLDGSAQKAYLPDEDEEASIKSTTSYSSRSTKSTKSLKVGGDNIAHAIKQPVAKPPTTTRKPDMPSNNLAPMVKIRPMPEKSVVDQKKGCASYLWWFFSRLCTILIPFDFLLCWNGNGLSRKEKGEARQAWREKVAIFMIMMACCAGFLGVSGVIPVVICRMRIAGELAEDQLDRICQDFDYLMTAMMILIAAVLVVQCLTSLIYIFRIKALRTIPPKDTKSKVVVFVPCYNEGTKELRKTIDSVIETTYPGDNKVLMVVADGNITGKGEKMSTPMTLAKLLGFTMKDDDKLYDCTSIGHITKNRCKLYTGIYKDAGKELKYIVVVKAGTKAEKGNPKAGNRGKRDSQLLFMGLLNRFHHGRKLNDLDYALKNSFDMLRLPLDEVRYMMAIDADTRVNKDSISQLAKELNDHESTLACCGETKVDNKTRNWVTWIQVFEYYTNHHMKKAFESVFGCVTCLPGCFTMYRLFSDDGEPLLSCDDVYQRYATNTANSLHEKNLFHLGEDRMLTTLLLQYCPGYKLSFVPEASCYTIAPDSYSVLLSQRRRWINSTFHNMLELLKVKTLCHFGCFSMKAIVALDLISTLIMPATLLYLGYVVFITVYFKEPVTIVAIAVWGIVLGVQVVIFLFRFRFDYLGWFAVFMLLGTPVFYFILPLYSFWHMDDFGWGSTRLVAGEGAKVGAASGGKRPATRGARNSSLCIAAVFLMLAVGGTLVGVYYGIPEVKEVVDQTLHVGEQTNTTSTAAWEESITTESPKPKERVRMLRKQR